MWFLSKKTKNLGYNNVRIIIKTFKETYDEENSFQLHKNTLWTGKIYRIRSQQNSTR